MSSNSFDLLPIDRRTRRTRALLAEALMDLGVARNIDAIDIGDLTKAAGIGRSTFYAHYAGRDDFMISSFVNLIVMAEEALATRYPERPDIIPSDPLFAHIFEAGDFARNVAKSEIFPRQMAAAEGKLQEIAEKNLSRRMPDLPKIRRQETAIYIAAGFIGLLRWWMTGGLKQSPQEMQRAFFRLSMSALASEA